MLWQIKNKLNSSSGAFLLQHSSLVRSNTAPDTPASFVWMKMLANCNTVAKLNHEVVATINMRDSNFLLFYPRWNHNMSVFLPCLGTKYTRKNSVSAVTRQALRSCIVYITYCTVDDMKVQYFEPHEQINIVAFCFVTVLVLVLSRCRCGSLCLHFVKIDEYEKHRSGCTIYSMKLFNVLCLSMIVFLDAKLKMATRKI